MIWRALCIGLLGYAATELVKSAMASKNFELWAKLMQENNLTVGIRCPANDKPVHNALLYLRDMSWRCEHCKVTGWLTHALDPRKV